VLANAVPGGVGGSGRLIVVPTEPQVTLGTAGGTLGELGMGPKEPKGTLGATGGALDDICEEEMEGRAFARNC